MGSDALAALPDPEEQPASAAAMAAVAVAPAPMNPRLVMSFIPFPPLLTHAGTTRPHRSPVPFFQPFG